MNYRQFNTNFWEDGYVLDLPFKEQLMFAYLFTNPRVKKCGIYELPDKVIRFRFELTNDELETVKQKFEADRKYFFHKGWVYIVNFDKHSNYSTAENVLRSIVSEFNTIPFEIKQHFLIDCNLDYKIPVSNFKKYLTISVGDKDIVMVMDKDNSLGGSLGGSLESIDMTMKRKNSHYFEKNQYNEDVDPDSIPI